MTDHISFPAALLKVLPGNMVAPSILSTTDMRLAFASIQELSVSIATVAHDLETHRAFRRLGERLYRMQYKVGGCAAAFEYTEHQDPVDPEPIKTKWWWPFASKEQDPIEEEAPDQRIHELEDLIAELGEGGFSIDQFDINKPYVTQCSRLEISRALAIVDRIRILLDSARKTYGAAHVKYASQLTAANTVDKGYLALRQQVTKITNSPIRGRTGWHLERTMKDSTTQMASIAAELSRFKMLDQYLQRVETSLKLSAVYIDSKAK